MFTLKTSARCHSKALTKIGVENGLEKHLVEKKCSYSRGTKLFGVNRIVRWCIGQPTKGPAELAQFARDTRLSGMH